MISDPIEICCRSSPSTDMKPAVIASVSGIDSAISNAERHSQNPIRGDDDHQHDRLVEAAHEDVDELG